MEKVKTKVKASTKVKQKDIDATDVYQWAKEKKMFTTTDVVDEFEIEATRAAAFIAIMRIKGQLAPSTGKLNGVSVWTVLSAT